MVVKYAVDGKQAEHPAINTRHLGAKSLGAAIRRDRGDGRGFILRRPFRTAENLAGTGVKKSGRVV